MYNDNILQYVLILCATARSYCVNYLRSGIPSHALLKSHGGPGRTRHVLQTSKISTMLAVAATLLVAVLPTDT